MFSMTTLSLKIEAQVARGAACFRAWRLKMGKPILQLGYYQAQSPPLRCCSGESNAFTVDPARRSPDGARSKSPIELYKQD
jgi:hypothetical protein